MTVRKDSFSRLKQESTAWMRLGLTGGRAKLDPGSRHCFAVHPGKAIEFSLTLAADAVYGGAVPSLGVE